MLVAVLALVGMVAVIATVLLAMTMTASRVSGRVKENGTVVSQADSALESTLAAMRTDPAAAQSDCHGGVTLGSHPNAYIYPGGASVGDPGSVIVACETTGAFTAVRDVTLRAYLGSPERLAGVARAKITDVIGGQVRPGIEVVVCDWQLGSAVRSDTAACP